MPARVILGKKGTDTGLFVSVPGKNAATSTVDEDFLINSNRINTQPVWKRIITNPVLTRDGRSYTPPKEDRFWFDGTYIGWKYSAVGLSYYTTTINHGLGYIPMCHLSVGSTNGGDPYPSIFIDNNKITLEYRETQGIYNQEPSYVTSWTNGYGLTCDMPASYTATATFHLTLFRQRM
jgi:hypothetical protein